LWLKDIFIYYKKCKLDKLYSGEYNFISGLYSGEYNFSQDLYSGEYNFMSDLYSGEYNFKTPDLVVIISLKCK